jgi:hypothetical protein
VLLNGSAAPPPLVVRAGVPHRLRLINMTTARPGVRFELHRDTTLLSWRQLAKDGADLPAARRAPRAARQPVAIGETVDVELLDLRPGELRLEVWTTTERLMATLPIRVTGAAETLTTRAP